MKKLSPEMAIVMKFDAILLVSGVIGAVVGVLVE